MAVGRGTIKWYEKLSIMADHFTRVFSLHPVICCGIIGGIAGATLDLDHIPLWLFKIEYPIPVELSRENVVLQGDNLHGIALVGGVLLCACAGGLIVKLVLEHKKHQK